MRRGALEKWPQVRLKRIRKPLAQLPAHEESRYV